MNKDKIVINTCFAGDCKWRKQESCVVCSHPNAIIYYDLKKQCTNCGRKPNEQTNGCGGCMGRGAYVYPSAYEQCDCGGYEQNTK